MSTAPPSPSSPAPAPITMRRATADDVPAIVSMLADDHLGAQRENPDEPAAYREAFDRIAADPNQHLIVAERDGRTIGTLQLTVIPGLSRRGSSRALIEAVRVHADARGSGLGSRLIAWAVEEAQARAAPWSNSPPTPPASTPTASTNGSASRRHTSGSRCGSDSSTA